jgi:hypothetical protein
VVAAPTLTATASSRLARNSVVERLACSTATAAATSADTRPASRNSSTARTSPARAIWGIDLGQRHRQHRGNLFGIVVGDRGA